MKNPILLNDFKSQWTETSAKALAAMDRVGKSGWLILGKEVEAFEAELARYWGLPYAVGCANGLDAIEIALRALKLPSGFKALTTPLSAFATTLAIVRAGGHPVFVDTDENGQIDLDLAEAVFKAHSDIRVFVPVHLFGHALDLERLKKFRDTYGIQIIEDCAQAIGAKSRGVPVGSIGMAAATSFYPTKNLGCMGDGGALLTRSDVIAKEARSLRDYGQSEKYTHSLLGLNSRLDELQAAILRDAFLPALEGATHRRKQIAERMISGLKHSEFETVPPPLGSESVWHLFPILLKSPDRRDSLRKYLGANGIGNGIHYPGLIPNQPALAESPYTVVGPLKKAERFVSVELSLPIHPYLTDNEVSRVIEVLNQWK